jgi:hypothetical protein
MTRSVAQLVASHEENMCGLHEEARRLANRSVLESNLRGAKAECMSVVFGAMSEEVCALVLEVLKI